MFKLIIISLATLGEGVSTHTVAVEMASEELCSYAAKQLSSGHTHKTEAINRGGFHKIEAYCIRVK